jgi:hypothetical protein
MLSDFWQALGTREGWQGYLECVAAPLQLLQLFFGLVVCFAPNPMCPHCRVRLPPLFPGCGALRQRLRGRRLCTNCGRALTYCRGKNVRDVPNPCPPNQVGI